MSYKNETVRFWAVKTLGKLGDDKYLERLYKMSSDDESTKVRREAVSAIGRMRIKRNIPFLKQMLLDEDPKVVCQAIRGLLVFKGDEDVDEALKKLQHHENEMVRAVVRKEYFSQVKKYDQKPHHTVIYPYLKNVVVNGDVRDVLKLVPESIHLTFTSPPYYNARDYSIYPSYEAYLKFLEEVFYETYRI